MSISASLAPRRASAEWVLISALPVHGFGGLTIVRTQKSELNCCEAVANISTARVWKRSLSPDRRGAARLSEASVAAFGYGSASLEDQKRDLLCIYNRVLMSVIMASREDTLGQRFKIVCDDCGSLSIKVADPANSPASTLVHCGRCSAIRGTLDGLHDLARRGTELFEF